jgi:hypothetical protein
VLYTIPEAGGALTVLYDFCALPGCKDGSQPIGPVRIDHAGNIYGVSAVLNRYTSYSIVWEINTAGQQKVISVLPEIAEGGLAIDAQDNLYGFTSGGASDGGSVFKLIRKRK